MVNLGVGKNMVQSIKHWCNATRLVEGRRSKGGRMEYLPTALSERIIFDEGFDPFLEDHGTLWLLHWNLASNDSPCATWFWLFNHWNGIEFTKDAILEGLSQWLDSTGDLDVSETMLRRDLDCCLRTYVHARQNKSAVTDESFDCPLTELNLITELSDRTTYQFRRGEQKSLPDEVLLFSVVEFWEKSGESGNTLSLERIAYDAGSPGRVFKIDQESLAYRLDQLTAMSDGAFIYQESGGIKQVLRHREVAPIKWIERYFERITK